MKLILIIGIIFITIFLTGCQNNDTNNKSLNVHEVKELIKNENPLIVDIRTPEEFNAGHIQNSININFYDSMFFEDMKELPQDKPILIYCRSASRTAMALRGLEGQMQTEVYELAGGTIAWQNKSEKLVK